MDRVIGREHELAVLRAALAAAQSGRAQVALLTGEPGIGKTSTARAFAAIASAQDAMVLWGRCFEEPGAPAYWPWIQILRQFAQRHDDDALCTLLGASAGYVAEICADLRDRLPGLATPQPLADAAQARFRMFDAVTSFWKRAAAVQSLVLVLEDLHWADVPSLRLLEFVAGEIGAARMLLVATFRDLHLPGEHPLLQLTNQLQRRSNLQRLPLIGLQIEHTARLIEAATGSVPTKAATAFVQAKTAGNPLFVGEVARYLAREGHLTSHVDPGSAWHVPDGIRAFISSRSHRLSRAAQSTLRCAAVIGARYNFGMLHRLLDPELSEDVLTALDEALAARIIERLHEPGWYQFAHVLTRDTLYDELPALERARLHQRVGAALEADHRHHLAPYLSLLAYHFIAALPAGSSAQAIAYAMQAAEEARARLAYEEAARCLDLALSALEQTAPLDAKLRCKLTIALGSARMKSGQTLAALEALTDAASEASYLGAASELAQAAIDFEEVAWRMGLRDGRAMRLLEQSLHQVSETDGIARARLQSALVRAKVFAGLSNEARTLHEETVQLARRLGDAQSLQAALHSRFWLAWEPAELIALLATANESLALAEQSGNDERILDASAFRLHLLIATGDTHGFAVDLQRFARLADELQQPFHRYHAACMRAAQALASGWFAEAQALARAAVELGMRVPGLDASGAYGMQMFTIARERGELPQLAPLVEQFVQMTPGSATWQPALALVLAELGHIEKARAKLTELSARQFDSIARDSLWLVCIAYLAETCTLLRERACADALYALLAPWTGRNIIAGSVVVCYGPADRYLGMLCAVVERWHVAERHFETALKMSMQQGARPWLAHAQLQYAAMLLERKQPGDRERARELMLSARKLGDDMGMAALKERLLLLEGRLQPGSHAAAYPGGLSKREAQVLRLIAAGKSNREIADTLFRSPNTVANHVRSILAKLGTANRTEAATFAARHGLL
jgi:DNA-binding CsgD family transcriptional regulator